MPKRGKAFRPDRRGWQHHVYFYEKNLIDAAERSGLEVLVRGKAIARSERNEVFVVSGPADVSLAKDDETPRTSGERLRLKVAEGDRVPGRAPMQAVGRAAHLDGYRRRRGVAHREHEPRATGDHVDEAPDLMWDLRDPGPRHAVG